MLQKFLAQYRIGSSTQLITGYFGALTKAHLIAFQKEQHIAATGDTSTSTRAAIESTCTNSATTTPAPAPLATIDDPLQTSLQSNAHISGTASSAVGPLNLSITSTTTPTPLFTADLSVTDGLWSVVVFPPLSNGTYAVNLYAKDTLVASSTLTVGLQSLPVVDLDTSLPSYDIADGRLMRFTVKANGNNPIGIAQLTFAVAADNTSVDAASLYGYTDADFSQPIASTTDGLLNTVPISPVSSPFSIIPDSVIEIPPGQTYYFELDSAVTPSDGIYTVTTTLLGDTASSLVGTAVDLASSSLVWSPNTYGTSSISDPDWTNASPIFGLPAYGLAEQRSGTPATPTPTCTMSMSPETASVGQPVLLTWSSTDAQYVVWGDGTKDALQGSKTVVVGSSTRPYILNFYNTYGETTCFETIGASSSGTSTVATAPAAPTDGFVATPTSGTVPLPVVFAGTVNTAKSCSALTFSLGYGDGATSTISVAKNVCKAQTFSFSHSYGKVGLFRSALYKGTGTSTAQLLQVQTITVKAKVAMLFDPANNVAAVFSAVENQFKTLMQRLPHFFGW